MVLCLYEVILFYPDMHRTLKIVFQYDFRLISHTLAVSAVGAGSGKHGALKVVFHWLFEVN